MAIDSAQVQSIANRLAALRTAEQIKALRRTLDKDTARAVIQALSPVDRGAVLLCLAFDDDHRFAPWRSEIIHELSES